MNIVLIGYRGSGKSSIGQALAAKLGREFVDTDALVTQAAGKTIKEIFEAGGELRFRELESQAIGGLAGKDDLVVAVGGGAVLRAENVANLKKNGRLIWLQADVSTLFVRISSDKTTNAMRPNLTLGGGLEEIRVLLALRTPIYQAIADATLEVSHLTIDDAVDYLAQLI